MSIHGISMAALLIIFLIAMLLFGPKQLRLMLEDLNSAINNVKKVLRAQKLEKQSKLKNFDQDAS